MEPRELSFDHHHSDRIEPDRRLQPQNQSFQYFRQLQMTARRLGDVQNELRTGLGRVLHFRQSTTIENRESRREFVNLSRIHFKTVDGLPVLC